MNILESIAGEYAARKGFNRFHSVKSRRQTEAEGLRIADIYERRRHSPTNPRVRKSYGAFNREMDAQFRALRRGGIRYTFTKKDPYKSAGSELPDFHAMRRDLLVNHRLKVWTGGSKLPASHPLAAKSPTGQTYNNVFRAVHDTLGHAAKNNSFSSRGEYHAFLTHAQLFSRRARGALAWETLGQTDWLDYGPHLRIDGRVPHEGERGYVPFRDRPYAEQKANVLEFKRLNA